MESFLLVEFGKLTMLHSVFALELALRMDVATGLLDALRGFVKSQPVAVGLQQKWSVYRQASLLLAQNLQFAERGCWDYFDDDAKARRDFDMWCGGMITEEGARKSPSGVVGPYRGEPRYLTFTMAFLLVQGTPTDIALRGLCNIPKDRLWQRQTLSRILNGMGVINFASVKGDVMYLIPRDGDWGLTADDLTAKKFEYLRMLSG